MSDPGGVLCLSGLNLNKGECHGGVTECQGGRPLLSPPGPPAKVGDDPLKKL